MPETTEIWVERIRKLDDDTEVREVVHEVYETAQKDLDDKRAEAEFEREE
jgi:hypothetical protein